MSATVADIHAAWQRVMGTPLDGPTPPRPHLEQELAEAIAELLEKAAAYIEEVGAYDHNYWQFSPAVSIELAIDRRLPVCLLGSLQVAARQSGHDPEGALYQAASEAMDDHLGEDAGNWNDEPGRTAAEVADALRKCATELREAS